MGYRGEGLTHPLNINPRYGLAVGKTVRYETFQMTISQQRYGGHAIIFASWQHPAMRRGARFAVSNKVVYVVLCYDGCAC